MKQDRSYYIPALRYPALTRFYDGVIRATMREDTFRSELLSHACVQNDFKVLDIGCGTGSFLVLLKTAYPGTEAVGLDGDISILDIAKEKSRKKGLEISFAHGLSHQLPYPDNSFNRVFSSLLFHHLDSEQKAKTLLEIHRVLKPGGELHIADWGKASHLGMRSLFLMIQLLDGFSTTGDNVSGQLPHYIEHAGFTKVEVTKSFSTVFGTLSLFSARK